MRRERSTIRFRRINAAGRENFDIIGDKNCIWMMYYQYQVNQLIFLLNYILCLGHNYYRRCMRESENIYMVTTVT